jgi:hypothetical protein
MTARLFNKRLENFGMEKKRAKTQANDQELLLWVDYLHGDVLDSEFKAACQYEYSRKSNILRKASELLRCDPAAYGAEIVFKIEREFHCDSWFISPEWMFVWQCPSFPARGWNQLTEEERSDLLCGLPLSTKKARPLVFGEVMFLTHYLDELKEIADKACAEWKEARAAGKPRRKVYPILQLKGTPFVQALLPLNFSKSRKRLLQEIDKWLELPENKDRFDKHKPMTEVGTEKQAKDRLKDLAAWRLYRELGCDKALSFAEENRKRDESGKPRPFHDPRKGQTKKVPPNEAPLYSEESGFLKAKKRAEDHLAKLIPWEFGKYAEEKEQQKRQWLLRSKRH